MSFTHGDGLYAAPNLHKLAAERYTIAANLARVGVWDWHFTKEEIFWDKYMFEVYKLPETTPLSYAMWAAMVMPEDYEPTRNAILRLQNGEDKQSTFLFRARRADGEIRLMQSTATALTDEHGKVYRLIGIHIDITEQKRTQDELALSESRFRGAFENSSIGMGLLGLNGHWMMVNKAFCQMLRYTEDELMQKSIIEITHPEDRAEDLKNAELMIAGAKQTYQREKRYLDKYGNIVWGMVIATIVRDTENKPQYLIGQVKDITDRKIAEQKISQLNRELTGILNSGTQVSIISTNTEGVIEHFSKGAEMLLGYTAAEMEGIQTPAVLHDAEEMKKRAQELTEIFEKPISGFEVFIQFAKQHKTESREWTYVRKDGSRFPVQKVVSAITDEAGNITGYLCIATDISQRKRAEETALRYAKLEAKNKETEQFAYIASHDLQEPLRTVHSYVELLKEEYTDKLSDDANLYLDYISQSVDRMMEQVRELLNYSLIGKERKLEKIDCNQLVQEILHDMTVLVQETGAVVSINQLPTINAYPAELKRLFQNLINNALKFKKKEEHPVIEISANKQGGKWVFSIKDNGIGISEKDMDKIFILFKRLHHVKQYPGTGIGLAQCKKIVEMHNGNIWVESVAGEGSIFNFTVSV